MTIKEAVRIIEQRFPTAQAEDFDNVGLLCGRPESDISGILVCHDALEHIVEEAIERNCNLIVCFHPIIFSGLKKITGKNYVERAVLKALENKIAIYAVHTVLDNDYFGVNKRICDELGLVDQRILLPKQKQLLQLTVYVPHDYAEKVKNALFSAGAGNIGFYDECSFNLRGDGTFRPLPGSDPATGSIGCREDAAETQVSVILESHKKQQVLARMKEAHPYEEVAYQLICLENENQYEGLGRYGELPKASDEEEFLKQVKTTFDIPVIRHSGFRGKPIKRVGVLGGSGASAISAAKAADCDIYLTGDVKYHDFFQTEDKMVIADIGHFESERFVVSQLHEFLSEKFTKFAILKSEINTNPVNYF